LRSVWYDHPLGRPQPSAIRDLEDALRHAATTLGEPQFRFQIEFVPPGGEVVARRDVPDSDRFTFDIEAASGRDPEED
jgi:hypothetical protein